MTMSRIEIESPKRYIKAMEIVGNRLNLGSDLLEQIEACSKFGTAARVEVRNDDDQITIGPPDQKACRPQKGATVIRARVTPEGIVLYDRGAQEPIGTIFRENDGAHSIKPSPKIRLAISQNGNGL